MIETPIAHDLFAAQLRAMVNDQLASRGIRDHRVLEAMLCVPRHEFVPEWYRGEAYEDHPIPIGENQTISQPFMVARMLELSRLLSTDRALEIGTGSGYLSALLGVLCAHVTSVERHAALATRAAATLERLGYSKVAVRTGDGTQGWAPDAPYDAILVSAAAYAVPPALFEQLAEGGRLVIPVGSADYQRIELVHKHHENREVFVFEGCRFVPLIGSVSSRNEP
jgi:protein-L-isoaspartate(D-aspartate) O-methyltransferase